MPSRKGEEEEEEVLAAVAVEPSAEDPERRPWGRRGRRRWQAGCRSALATTSMRAANGMWLNPRFARMRRGCTLHMRAISWIEQQTNSACSSTVGSETTSLSECQHKNML